MARSAILTIKILADASKAAAGMDKASGSTSKFAKGLEKAALPAAAIGTALVAFGVKAGKAASEAEQAAGAVDAVFGKTAKAIHRFGQTSADTVGLSTSAYEQLAATFGAQLKNMGVAADELAPKTNELVKLGSDLAAQYGGTTADAVAALGSLMRGETDPIEKYGVSIKQADIQAQKAAMGLDGLTGAADKSASTQATLALLTKQTASAHGAFARESDTAAHAQQVANAQWENTQATLGAVLLPLFAQVATVLGKIAGVMGKNARATQILLGVIGGLAAAILIANAAMKTHAIVSGIVEAVQKRAAASTILLRIQLLALSVQEKAAAIASKAFAAAQWLLNAALSANPIGLVVIALVGLVAVIVLAYKKSETFRKIVDAAFRAVLAAARAAWQWIKGNWPLLVAILAGPIGIAARLVINNWQRIRSAIAAVWAWIRSTAGSAWAPIRNAAQAVTSWLRSNVPAAFRAVAGLARSILSPITGAFNAIKHAIDSVIGAVNNLIGRLSSIHVPKISLPSLPGRSAPAVAQAPAVPGARGARSTRTSGASSGSVNITINGALDPEAVARQIQRIVSGHSVRVGRAARVGA